MKTHRGLEMNYGPDFDFLVSGNWGDRLICRKNIGVEEAIRIYNDRSTWFRTVKGSPDAHCVMISVPRPEGGRNVYREWIDEDRFKWDEDPESLAYHSI